MEYFHGWPQLDILTGKIHGFRPFTARQPNIVLKPAVLDLSGFVDTDVDVCTSASYEESSELSLFYGDVSRQERIRLKFSKFLEGFRAKERGEPHWIHDSRMDMGFTMYLSQCTLYSSEPEVNPIQLSGMEFADLLNIVPFLSDCHIRQVNLWMNISPVLSSLHYDSYNNIILVLSGTKRVVLAHPIETSKLQPFAAYSLSGGANHSHTTMSTVESLYPGKVDTLSVVLEAGDALFIPEGWWHEVIRSGCDLY